MNPTKWVRSIPGSPKTHLELLMALIVGLFGGIYVSWLVADLVPRGVGLAGGWLASSVFTWRHSRRRSMRIAFLWLLAALIVMTPIFLLGSTYYQAGRFGVHIKLVEIDIIITIAFIGFAGLLAGLGLWLNNKG